MAQRKATSTRKWDDPDTVVSTKINYTLRTARKEDIHDLLDIDAKCFEFCLRFKHAYFMKIGISITTSRTMSQTGLKPSY